MITLPSPRQRLFASGFAWGLVAAGAALFLCLRFFPFATHRVLQEATLETDFRKSLKMEKAQLAVCQAKDDEERFVELEDAAMLTAQFGDPALAESFARDLLSRAALHPGKWNYGNAVHKGHQAWASSRCARKTWRPPGPSC